MNIVLGEQNVADLIDRYVVLSLDSFLIGSHPEPIKSFCVIENMPVAELAQIDVWKSLHENLIQNYQKRNWNFCEQAIEHLVGRWNGELDSFYQDLLGRVQELSRDDPGPEWTPVVSRS